MASLVSDNPDAVRIAICHLTFNILGILVWFPWNGQANFISKMRQVPLNMARFLGRQAVKVGWVGRPALNDFLSKQNLLTVVGKPSQGSD